MSIGDLELPCTVPGDIVPVGSRSSFFVLLNASHAVSERILSGRPFDVFCVRYTDVTGHQSRVLRAEKRRDETLVTNAFE
jgi:hypothetical protein